MRSMDVDLVNVFTQKGSGGKPCPVVCRADGMLDADMQSVACE
jgi:predicted PhzF superfamily epimerase YddE/YHI9